MLEVCGMDRSPDEERGMLEPPMGEHTFDHEFNYLAKEIETVTGYLITSTTNNYDHCSREISGVYLALHPNTLACKNGAC